MSYAGVLVHTATPIMRLVGDLDEDELVEGSYGETETRGVPFRCCLFLPLVGEQTQTHRFSKQVQEPTLLCARADTTGQPLRITAGMVLGIVAAQLNVEEGYAASREVRWEVNGLSQPFGNPKRARIVGRQVTVKRVTE